MAGNDNKSNGDRPKSLDQEKTSNLMGEEIDDEVPPPPPALSPSLGRPPPPVGRPTRPSPPAYHNNSGMSIVSDISFDSPMIPRDSKVVVADILDQVSTGAVETPSRRVQQQLTVADIKGASPMEAEAETLLLQSLEDKESKSSASAAILPNVPLEAMASFEGEPVEPPPPDVGADVKEKTFHEMADEVRASNTSTKRKLGGLAKAMRILQNKTSIGEVQHVPETDTGSFLNHADVLFRQSHASEKEKEAVTPNRDAPISSSAEIHDVEEGGPNLTSSNRNSQAKSPTHIAKHAINGAKVGVTTELTMWQDFVEPKKSNAWKYVKWVTRVLILPLLIVAIILFYGFKNPMLRDTGASISWVCLFILRNLLTFSLAKFTEVVVIDYLSLRRRIAVKVCFLFACT